MSYSPQTWTDLPSETTPMSAARLGHMETGIEDADTRITALESGKQAADSDLTTIAALSPANDDVLQRKAGAWANRTIAQLRTDIGVDPAAGTGGLRTLGTSATAACAGNDSRLSDARTPTAHNHSGADLTSGTVAAARLPLVPNPPVTLTYAASLTPDAAAGNYQVVTCTGAVTLNPPTNPVDGQKLHVRFIASAAQRVITLSATLQARRLTNVLTSITIPADKRGDVLLHYEAADSASWTVMAFGAQQ